MRHRPLILGTLIGLAIITALMAVFTQMQRAPSGSRQLSEDLQFGGPFTLTEMTGGTVTQASLLGKPTVMFFGFTSCPDVCPTTLSDMSNMIDALGDKADALEFVFVSVDPERDTPEQMREYLAFFSDKIRGFTGTTEQVEAMTKAYGVYYEKVPLEDGGYTVDHTASVFLFDEEGDFFATIDFHEDRSVALGKLERLINSAG